jgi:hypothetical protein
VIQVIRSDKKTNAQKCKEYRERKKSEDERVPKNSAQRSDECRERDQLQEIKKKPKTDAQRSKEYRERQKIKKQIVLQMKNTNHLHIYIIYSERNFVPTGCPTTPLVFFF